MHKWLSKILNCLTVALGKYKVRKGIWHITIDMLITIISILDVYVFVECTTFNLEVPHFYMKIWLNSQNGNKRMPINQQ